MFLKDLVLPESSKDFIINKEAILKISRLFSEDFMSNLYIYGPAGSGKYSLFIKTMESIVGKKIKINYKKINLSNSWSQLKEINIPSSEFHFEINLNKYTNNRNNLFSLIEAVTDSKEINQTLQYRIILVRNIQFAGKELLRFIKQKAEILSEDVRFILIGKTSSRDFSELKGIFVGFRHASPSADLILKVVKQGIKKYNQINSEDNHNGKNKENHKITKDVIIDIIQQNNRNLNYIFLYIEMLVLNNFYKSRIDTTATSIYKLIIEKKISNLGELRELLYDYQVHNEDIDELFLRLMNLLFCNKEIDDNKKIKINTAITQMNLNKKNGYKEIIHIERCLFQLFMICHE